MKSKIALTSVLLLMLTLSLHGQVDNSFGSLPPFTKWYQNPLGVSPLALHTGNGLIVPAIAAGAILIFTKKDSTLINRLTVFDDAGYTKGYYGSYSNVFHNNLGINYTLRKYLSVGVELTMVFVTDEVNQTPGIGIRPFFRFYPINQEAFKLYFSSGAGLIYFFNNFPQPSGFFGDMREGTKLNGCPKYGMGAEIKISRRLYLNAGFWHIHFSNGDHPDYSRNPGHDSNGFSVGLTYKAGTSDQ